MAGNCRPIQCIDSKEARYKLLSAKNYLGTYKEGMVCGLFDGSADYSWADNRYFYWNNGSSYISLELYEQSSIWFSGNSELYNGRLTIEKYENNNWVNVGGIYPQLNTTGGQIGVWALLYEDLKPGVYRFMSSYRVDSEWFIESKRPPYNCLIKEDSVYKTIQDSQLIEVDISELNKEDGLCITNVGDIIPFLSQLSDTFELVFDKDVQLETSGLKSNLELIIPTGTFSTKLAKNIDYFELVKETSNNGIIKCAISDNKGSTWKVWDGSGWEVLNSTVPIKDYDTLTEEELNQWNSLKNEIHDKGFTPEATSNINYNLLDSKEMMMAYSINRPSYNDVAEMKNLNFKFDANGTFELLDNSSVEIEQSSDTIKVTPKRNMDMMKINIGVGSTETNNLNGIESNILNNLNVNEYNKLTWNDSILYTEEDIKNLKISADNIIVSVNEDGNSSKKTLQEVIDLLLNPSNTRPPSESEIITIACGEGFCGEAYCGE